MAIVNPAIIPCRGPNDFDGYQVTWAAMHNGDVGAAVGSTIEATPASAAVPPPGGALMAGYVDKTIQVNAGTFGTGGSVACEGSNDGGTTWSALSNPQGVTIALTAAGIQQVSEASIWTRPHVTAGDGTTNVNVTMFFRKVR